MRFLILRWTLWKDRNYFYFPGQKFMARPHSCTCLEDYKKENMRSSPIINPKVGIQSWQRVRLTIDILMFGCNDCGLGIIVKDFESSIQLVAATKWHPLESQIVVGKAFAAQFGVQISEVIQSLHGPISSK